MQGEKAHELAVSDHDRPALAGDADREAALRGLQFFPLQSLIGIDLLPSELRNLPQRLDSLTQFARVEVEQLLLKLGEIQVKADVSRHARLPARRAARSTSLSSFVSAGGVRFAHSPARRSRSRIAGS